MKLFIYFLDNLGVQAYKEQPTGKVVEALIQRANRLREDMIKSSLQKTTEEESHPIDLVLLNTTNNNAEKYQTKSFDTMDSLLDMKTSLKLTEDLNNSNDSILTDLDGLENEQSLLDDLLYGGEGTAGVSNNNHKHTPNKHHPRGKPPTGRSRSPSITRVGGLSNRSRSARSSDSDAASRVSFDMPSSDLDDSGNGKH
jgi:hypothetical protein